jgi:hypothetical protein
MTIPTPKKKIRIIILQFEGYSESNLRWGANKTSNAQPRFDTSHQLLFIVKKLWSQPLIQVGKSKQVVVARSEVKQLPVQMLQQC